MNCIEKIWNDDVVYIVAGGPSLKGFDWAKLDGKKVIAINRAFSYLPNADVLYFSDTRFYEWYRDDIEKFKGLKYTISNKIKSTTVKSLKRGHETGMHTDGYTLSHGNNSGYAAINLAYMLGAKVIILLGYDLNTIKTVNFHDGYNIEQQNNVYKNEFIPPYLSLPRLFKRLGVLCYNANQDSELNCFPKCSLDFALNYKI